VIPNINVYEVCQAILDGKTSGANVVNDYGKLVGVLSELDGLKALMTSVYNASDPGGELDRQTSCRQILIAVTEDLKTAH
jgi:CBS domain-containing protein